MLNVKFNNGTKMLGKISKLTIIYLYITNNTLLKIRRKPTRSGIISLTEHCNLKCSQVGPFRHQSDDGKVTLWNLPVNNMMS